jgi:hypothetical protein
MISTRDLSGLPSIDGFARLTRSVAVLDAIMSPEWQFRYYSFDAHWGENEMMASMRNGEGDQWCAVICEAGIGLVGLAHEAPAFRFGRPQDWIFRDLPEVFRENVMGEPAFDAENVSFCVWRLATDDRWRSGAPEGVEDGSGDLLSILDGDPRRYVEFARSYFEVEIAVDDVRAVYSHSPITPTLLARLNAEAEFDALAVELGRIGYPGGW